MSNRSFLEEDNVQLQGVQKIVLKLSSFTFLNEEKRERQKLHAFLNVHALLIHKEHARFSLEKRIKNEKDQNCPISVLPCRSPTRQGKEKKRWPGQKD